VEPSQLLAQAVKARRIQLGLTQEALSLRASTSLVFIYNIERGKPTLRFDKLLGVLTVLGLQLRVEVGNEGILDGTRVG